MALVERLKIRLFQSTLPARGATAYHRLTDGREAISIHAPCTGSDRHDGRRRTSAAAFQSTLPARGATERPDTGRSREPGFQSTLPARGATPGNPRRKEGTTIFQSTLPARGATRDDDRPRRERMISIHAPCTGSDCGHGKYCRTEQFQSTLPARGATRPRQILPHGADFNPRSLHGERPASL